jgi:hypothetical protein
LTKQIVANEASRAGTKETDAIALPAGAAQGPPLYIWLTETSVVSLDLEAAYELYPRML